MDDAQLRKFADRMLSSPHSAALGIELVSVALSHARLRAPWREDLVGDPDAAVIAGGVVTALLDHCCGLAIMAGRPGLSTATLDLRIDYMRPAAPRAGLVAEAHCYKRSRLIAFVRGQAFDASSDDPVATAQGAFMLSQRP